MSKGADLERRFGRNLYESLGARRKDESGAEDEAKKRFADELAEVAARDSAACPADGRTRLREAGVMELSRITPDPDQPRKAFNPDAIARLSASLKTHGQLQPIRVRWNEGLGKWIIIAGERRYRAAVEAGLATIQCIFVEKDEDSALWLAEQMVENCLREDLTPIEQALAFDRLIKTQGWSARRLAEELHVSPGSVSKALALLNLPNDLRKEVDSGAISATAGYELARISNPAQRQEVADRLLNKELKRDDVADFNRDTIGRAHPGETLSDDSSATPEKPVAKSKPKTKSKSSALAAELNAPEAPPVDEADSEPVEPAQEPGSVRQYKLITGAEITIRLPKAQAADADYMDAIIKLATALRAQDSQNGKSIVAHLITESR